MGPGWIVLAGWVARTRPLARPLSPRGPQPVGIQNAVSAQFAQWSDSPKIQVRGSWYYCPTRKNIVKSHVCLWKIAI